MNKTHLLYWVWKYLESHEMSQGLINRAKHEDWQFSENKQAGQISVSDALEESLNTFKKSK